MRAYTRVRLYVPNGTMVTKVSEWRKCWDSRCRGVHTMNAFADFDMPWDRDMVAAYLAEAADTLRRLPGSRLKGYFNTWPQIVQTYWEAYAAEDEKPRLGPPAPEAIDRLDMALPWLGWLEPGEAELVWLRAEGVQWKVLQSRYGIGRTTGWMRWMTALEKIAARLNHQRV